LEDDGLDRDLADAVEQRRVFRRHRNDRRIWWVILDAACTCHGSRRRGALADLDALVGLPYELSQIAYAKLAVVGFRPAPALGLFFLGALLSFNDYSKAAGELFTHAGLADGGVGVLFLALVRLPVVGAARGPSRRQSDDDLTISCRRCSASWSATGMDPPGGDGRHGGSLRRSACADRRTAAHEGRQ